MVPKLWGANRCSRLLHGIVNPQPGLDLAAGAADIHLDRLFAIVTSQIEQLRNDQIGYITIWLCIA
jgi:hypothetical protein